MRREGRAPGPCGVSEKRCYTNPAESPQIGQGQGPAPTMGEATGRAEALQLRSGGISVRGRDLLSIADLTPEELRRVLDTAHALKAGLRSGESVAPRGEDAPGGRPEGRPYVAGEGALRQAQGERLLAGKVLALVFEKPSLRTRVSFDVGMRQLGGECLYLSPPEGGLGSRGPVEEVGRTLSRSVDGIAARTFEHHTVEELARWA